MAPSVDLRSENIKSSNEAWQGCAGSGVAWWRQAWRGAARQGRDTSMISSCGKAVRGQVWHGAVRQGEAWPGLARQGEARQGRD